MLVRNTCFCIIFVLHNHYNYQCILLQAILCHLAVERKEKEELLAEEQRNIDEKLKAMENEQLHRFEKAKRAEVCLYYTS